MSIGFHYFEAQTIFKPAMVVEEEAPAMGKLIAVGSIPSLVVYSAM